MRDDRKVPKRFLKLKFRRNLEEFKTRAHTPDNAYKRIKTNTNKILEDILDEQSFQPEQQRQQEVL